MQLPVPPPAALAATGNVPLAAGCLGVAAQASALSGRLEVEVVPPSATDRLGDTLLAERVAAGEPEFVGLSLYLWNTERSLHLAREVKRRSPRTRVLVGGPEVSADNAFLLSQEGFDLALAGEGEEALIEVVSRLLDGGEGAGLPRFWPALPALFPLARYPSPYLSGLVPVERERSVYLEAARGCRSGCTFCFYPRAGSGLRVLNPAQVEALMGGLRDRGAKDLSFLDPTFNHRPDFEPLLDALVRANPGRAMSLFAEVRPEGLSSAHAAKLAQAGFTRLELGLQSVNPLTLKRVGRGGNPAKVAEAARALRGEGIELLVDLIVGLPGDTADDVARGVDFLEEHGLQDSAQVFGLFVLPGTAMRESAAKDGLLFEPAPPYRVIRSATMSEQQIHEALVSAEERFGRRLDERPRPHLVSGEPPQDPREVFRLDLDRAGAKEWAEAAKPGAQHCALWLEGKDLFARRAEVMRAIDARLGVDPYATLDVVLSPEGPFPLDLLDLVRARLGQGAPSYASRALAHRNESYQRRVAVVLGANVQAPADWVSATMEEAPVFRDQSLQQAAADVALLGDELPGARVVSGPGNAAALALLQSAADPEAVAFEDRQLEAGWQRRAMGYGDAGD
ncbi:MAG: B12-binding domain-containing radical SAM protein [Myxococcaceae bacterium]